MHNWGSIILAVILVVAVYVGVVNPFANSSTSTLANKASSQITNAAQ